MQSYSNEQLRKLTDEELVSEYMSVRSKINMSKKANKNTIELEVYFCYVSQEVQERAKRTKKHTKVV